MGWPDNLTLWEYANSQFLATIVAATVPVVVALIGRQIVQKVDEESDRQKRKAVEEQMSKRHENLAELPIAEEVASVDSSSVPVVGKFSNASQSFKKIRTAVDGLTAKIPDGRRRRKYKNLRKTDLREHVYFLWQDDMLPLQVAELADDAISEFYSYRTRPNEIPDDSVELISKAADQLCNLAK